MRTSTPWQRLGGSTVAHNTAVIMTDLKTHSVPGLERGLSLLEMLSESPAGLTLSQFVRRSGLPKSSIHCLVITLVRRGYLRRCERTHRFKLGLKLLTMATAPLTQIELSERAAPHLNALMRETKLTVHMAIFEQNEAVLIGKVEAPALLKLSTWIGKRIEVHCTALGKALVAYLSDENLDRLIARYGLSRHNENTITSAHKLKSQLAQVRKVHYAFDDEEDEIGLRCIAAPIFNHLGRAVAAVSVSGSVSQITPENRGSLAQKVTKAALAISAELGGSPELAGRA